MASFSSNFSTRVIRVREGIRVPGGGYIFTDNEARSIDPRNTEFEIDHQRRIDPNVLQQWPGAEMVVELWVEGYGYKKIVTLKPAGGSIQAFDAAARCRTAVDIYYVRYTPGTRDLEEMRFLTTIYADHYHRH